MPGAAGSRMLQHLEALHYLRTQIAEVAVDHSSVEEEHHNLDSEVEEHPIVSSCQPLFPTMTLPMLMRMKKHEHMLGIVAVEASVVHTVAHIAVMALDRIAREVQEEDASRQLDRMKVVG